jgi:hypothetical protein
MNNPAPPGEAGSPLRQDKRRVIKRQILNAPGAGKPLADLFGVKNLLYYNAEPRRIQSLSSEISIWKIL